MHLKISNNTLGRDGSNVVIGITGSVERENRRRIASPPDEENEYEPDDERELFSGLLGNGDEDALQIKARKREEKKILVE